MGLSFLIGDGGIKRDVFELFYGDLGFRGSLCGVGGERRDPRGGGGDEQWGLLGECRGDEVLCTPNRLFNRPFPLRNRILCNVKFLQESPKQTETQLV